MSQIALNDDTIALVSVTSKFGPVHIAYSEQGILCLEFNLGTDQDFANVVRVRLGRDASLFHADKPAAAVLKALTDFLERKPVYGPFDLHHLTPFAQAVLRKTTEIPVGEVRSYGWLAKEVGSPGASRAVGSVMARNPIPLLIPCHRVVTSDGRLGNYSGGGPTWKQRLLAWEGADLSELKGVAPPA